MIPTIVFIACLATAQPPATHCKLTAVATNADLGRVGSGGMIEHAWTITNPSTTETIIIDKVQTSCGCVRVGVEPKTVTPGGRATVTIVLNTLTQPSGQNVWRATVIHQVVDALTKQPIGERLELPLILKAELLPEIRMSPAIVALSSTTTASAVVIIEDSRAKPLKPLKLQSSHPWLKATIDAAPATNSQWKLKLQTDATVPIGVHDGWVQLQTDDPAHPVVTVPVRIHQRSAQAVVFAPEEPTIELEHGSTSSILVHFRRPGGANVAIESIESETIGMTVKWSETSGPVTTCRVSVIGAIVAAKGQGELRVKFREPLGETLIVPIAWDTK